MLVENAPLGIIWCDLHGKVFQANQNLMSILGLSSLDEAKAMNVLEYPPLVQAGIAEEMRTCNRIGERAGVRKPIFG